MVTKLSKRELEVLDLLAKGLTSRQIADTLFISVQTVHVHRKKQPIPVHIYTQRVTYFCCFS
ncbi:LuxR C-terminal-related transcriptional regulator [Sphingobacterium paucimobilis]|uniref:LuxR C-terminal-related transcriptional regulator n=1 Tax=Sphingobacterium paucimobilis TaxID=1385985 RepID=UPI00373FD390